MTDDKVKRRLTTVLCADVHGYSRLMEADETGTLETLRRYRTAMAGLVERHDGRIVNTWGDAVIAEFASVVEAVQCAVEIQQEISNQESNSTNAHPMRFRIGINLGDVMVDGSDIYGDGVNIASRLQDLAEPGGVVVSSPVYEQVRNKLSIGFDCLGQQPMKNVAPVTSYRVTLAGQAAGRSSSHAADDAAHPADPSAAPATDAPRGRDTPEPATGITAGIHALQDWLAGLPRPVSAAIVISAFLIVINLLTGMHRIWFQWPVAVLLFMALLRTVLGRERRSDRRKEERRANRD